MFQSPSELLRDPNTEGSLSFTHIIQSSLITLKKVHYSSSELERYFQIHSSCMDCEILRDLSPDAVKAL